MQPSIMGVYISLHMTVNRWHCELKTQHTEKNAIQRRNATYLTLFHHTLSSFAHTVES